MRIPINLAREPFRRDRPMLVASAATAVLLLLTLAFLVSLAMQENKPKPNSIRSSASAPASAPNKPGSTRSCAVPTTPLSSIATS
jgi:hypothetical protein